MIRESYHGTVVNPGNRYETVKIYRDSSNRFLKLEIFDGNSWVVRNQITYDNCKSPFCNITGYDKLHILMDTKNGFGTYTNYTNISEYQYSVNSLNFPDKSVQKYRSINGGVFSTTINTYGY